jgi:hypothetical protein
MRAALVQCVIDPLTFDRCELNPSKGLEDKTPRIPQIPRIKACAAAPMQSIFESGKSVESVESVAFFLPNIYKGLLDTLHQEVHAAVLPGRRLFRSLDAFHKVSDNRQYACLNVLDLIAGEFYSGILWLKMVF